MGRYHLRGRSSNGEAGTELILARDSTAAVNEMRSRGFTEIELLSSASIR